MAINKEGTKLRDLLRFPIYRDPFMEVLLYLSLVEHAVVYIQHLVGNRILNKNILILHSRRL